MVVQLVERQQTSRFEKLLSLFMRHSQNKTVLKGLKLPIVYYLDEGIYVAECPLFFVASQGNSINEALDNVKEALEIYLSDENVRKTLPDTLEYTKADILQKSKDLFYEFMDEDYPLPDYHYKEIKVCIPIND